MIPVIFDTTTSTIVLQCHYFLISQALFHFIENFLFTVFPPCQPDDLVIHHQARKINDINP